MKIECCVEINVKRRHARATQRKQYRAEFKARVAFEALKGHKTMNELVGMYGAHPTQITTWSNHLRSELPQSFSTRRAKRAQDHEALPARRSQHIGPLHVELDWLKKNLDVSIDAKRELREPEHPRISRARQCALLGLPGPPLIPKRLERALRIYM